MEKQNGKEKIRIQIEQHQQHEEHEQHHKALLFDDIMEIIFRNLNYKDLSNAMLVCKKWLKIADREKCLRGPQCFMKHMYTFDLSREEKVEEFNFNCIGQSTIKPLIGFFFLPSILYYYSDLIIVRISKLLPTNCKIIMLFTPTVILNEIISVSEDCHELPVISKFYMVYALLPQIPNVELNMVVVRSTTSEDTGYTEYTRMIEEASRQNHEISACLMLFCNKYNESIRRLVDITCSSLLNNNEKMVSLYGGVVDYICDSECVAVLITGSIQTWSIVLEDCLTMELVKEKLKLFQEQVKLQKHSVGFVHSSHMRHHRLTDSECYEHEGGLISYKDDDLTIFKELFPKVPLVGYGINKLMVDDFMPSQIEQWSCFATFVILTYG